MFDLSGKKAVVTGAANGIGKAITSLFLERGARVVATDMSSEDLDAAFGQNDDVHRVVGDISEDTVQGAVVAAARDYLGGLDILVNNAGIAIAGDYETLTDEQFDHIMTVNVRSIFRLTRLALPLLKASEHGRVINLGSIMSDVAGPGLAIYGASKHAVAGLTKGMAVDFGPHGITANYLQPGAIWTKMSEPFMDDPDFRKYWEEKAPVGRLGEAHEVAMAALVLASDEAQFVSGTGLNVDGGAIVKF
jgi:NAD(P)-dependent dehydrogenase (short-subunit alcohol dehydrogenase family)